MCFKELQHAITRSVEELGLLSEAPGGPCAVALGEVVTSVALLTILGPTWCAGCSAYRLRSDDQERMLGVGFCCQ